MSVSQVLRDARERFPHAIAVYHGNHVLTFEQLFRDVESVAANLFSLGIGPGQMVATDIQRQVSHWVILLALMRVGAVSASLTDRSASEIETISGFAAMISEPEDTREYPEGLRRIRIGRDWLRAPPAMLSALPSAAEADRTVGRISFTSGTSGKPKAIVLDSIRLHARLSGTAGRSSINTRSTLWCGLGPDTAYGFTATVATWAEGGAVIFSKGGRGSYSYLAKCHLNLVIASPVALTAMLRDAIDGSTARLQGRLIIAGGRLPVALRDAARRRLCPDILIAYGASETGGVSLGSADELDRHLGHVGNVFPDVQVRIVDEQGAELTFGEPGLLQVRSESSATAYLNNEPATARHFRDGWFQSGDLAMLGVDGALIMLGRPADILNLGGVKIAAEDIDAAVRDNSEVDDACALLIDADSMAPQLAVIVVGRLWDPVEVAARIRERMPMAPRIHLLAAASIPRGPMGKVNRQELAAKVEAALARVSPDGSGFNPKRIGTF